MSFGKTIIRAIRGPGDFESILTAEREIFEDLKTGEDKKEIQEKLRKLKFQLEDVGTRTTPKNIQKRQYLQRIYDGLEALADNRQALGWDLEANVKKFSESRNLSNTAIQGRKLLGNVAEFTKQLEKKLQNAEQAKLKEMSEKPQKNKERAQKTFKRVLVEIKLPEKESYTETEQALIRSYWQFREKAKKEMGLTEDLIDENPEFIDILRIRVEALINQQPNPSASALPSPPGAAGTGLRGGRKTRKNHRKSRKARKGGKSRKH